MLIIFIVLYHSPHSIMLTLQLLLPTTLYPALDLNLLSALTSLLPEPLRDYELFDILDLTSACLSTPASPLCIILLELWLDPVFFWPFIQVTSSHKCRNTLRFHIHFMVFNQNQRSICNFYQTIVISLRE